MENIRDLISIKPTVETNARNEWGYIVGEFHERVATSMKAAGRRPWNEVRVAQRLSKAGYNNTEKARDFLKECQAADNFSKFFMGITKFKIHQNDKGTV